MQVEQKGKATNLNPPQLSPEGSTFFLSPDSSFPGEGLLSADSFSLFLLAPPVFLFPFPLCDASARCDKADKCYLYRAIKTISPRSSEMIIALGPRLQVS